MGGVGNRRGAPTRYGRPWQEWGSGSWRGEAWMRVEKCTEASVGILLSPHIFCNLCLYFQATFLIGLCDSGNEYECGKKWSPIFLPNNLFCSSLSATVSDLREER